MTGTVSPEAATVQRSGIKRILGAALRSGARYLVARAQEPSSWRGLIGVVTGAGAIIEPQLALQIISVGVSVAGLIGALLPDNDAQ